MKLSSHRTTQLYEEYICEAGKLHLGSFWAFDQLLSFRTFQFQIVYSKRWSWNVDGNDIGVLGRPWRNAMNWSSKLVLTIPVIPEIIKSKVLTCLVKSKGWFEAKSIRNIFPISLEVCKTCETLKHVAPLPPLLFRQYETKLQLTSYRLPPTTYHLLPSTYYLLNNNWSINQLIDYWWLMFQGSWLMDGWGPASGPGPPPPPPNPAPRPQTSLRHEPRIIKH